MRMYRVAYNGKEYSVSGKNAQHAIERLADRPVFGNPLIPYHIDWGMIDAYTRGVFWAEARAVGESIEPRRIFAQLIEN